MLRKVFFAASVVLLVASTASAATITYTLDLSVPGAFTLSAATSAGDNAGLVFYDVPLLGNVTAADNRSPVGTNAANFSPMGFNLLRIGDSGPLANPEFRGSQDTQGQAANLVYGFGQQANSWVGLGKTNIGAADTTRDEAWVVPMVIGVGTYTGTLAFNTASVDLVGNVWAQQGGTTAPAATIQLVTIPLVPEPATLSLLGIALVGGIGLVRRRKG